MTKELTKNNTFNLVYKREYQDSESYGYDEFFGTYYTIFRNVPIKFLNKLNKKDFKNKIKTFCDKNYNETATNATGYSEVEILTGDEYYRTYADEFGADIVDNDNSYFNDYGQLWNTRQFFKHDFSPELTKSLTADTYKNKLMREGGTRYGN
jgi:hypothetical protein